MFPEHEFYIRDVVQSYTQSNINLVRRIFLEPAPEMNLQDDEVLLAVRPLYGIPESGLHRFSRYHKHHLHFLDMKKSTADRCLLYRNEKSKLKGMTVIKVDDRAGHETPGSLNLEEKCSKNFQCKPRQILERGKEAFLMER